MGSKVSIVVCVYNGEGYIQTISDYIKKQTYRNIETIFVISDKCTDGSLKAAQECSVSLGECKVVLYENDKGLGDSKNCGIENSTGDLLWFLDVDDVPSMHYLEYMVKAREDSQADLIACNFMYSSNREPISEHDFDDKEMTIMDVKEAIRRRSMNKFPVGSWAMLYERAIIVDNGIRYPVGLAEDISFTYDYLMCVKKVCYYNKPLYKYYQRPESITNSRRGMDRRGTAEISIYDRLESEYSDRLDDDVKKRFVLVRLRSAGHMSLSAFIRYTKSDEVKSMVKRNRSPMVCFEYSCISALPMTYYCAIRIFFKVYFYKNGRTLT